MEGLHDRGRHRRRQTDHNFRFEPGENERLQRHINITGTILDADASYDINVIYDIRLYHSCQY